MTPTDHSMSNVTDLRKKWDKIKAHQIMTSYKFILTF